jgi:hypothetical protein
VPVSVTVSRKSAASSGSACERKDCVRVVAGPVRGGIDPGRVQDFPDRRRGDLYPHGEQFPVHSR